MAAVRPPRPLLINDNRSLFDCGREPLNAWFQRHAWANHSSGISRVNVLTDTADEAIVGYVTLGASKIERSFLPKAQQRNRPGELPVTLLGQLAVDRAYQGQGHAAPLLLFAFRTALRSAESVASFGVVTHPLDDHLRQFYRRWGFVDLPLDPHRAMIVRMVDLEQSFARSS